MDFTGAVRNRNESVPGDQNAQQSEIHLQRLWPIEIQRADRPTRILSETEITMAHLRIKSLRKTTTARGSIVNQRRDEHCSW